MRAALLSIAGWTIPGLLTAAVTVLVFPVPPQAHAYLGRFTAGFLASWWVWAGLTPFVRAAARRVPLERPWLRTVALHMVFALIAAMLFALWFSLMMWLSRPPTLSPEPYVAE